MKAYKGFRRNLSCRGHQFLKDTVNRTEKSNCRAEGFHCAENPLDCLYYYASPKNAVYYIVEAGGDLDEDDLDSKIACTELSLVRELSLPELLAEGVGYLLNYPNRKRSSVIKKDSGIAYFGYVVVCGEDPKAKGKLGDYLVLVKEKQGRITDVAMYTIDNQTYFEDRWYNIGKQERRGTA